MLTEMTAFYWCHALAHALSPLFDVIGACTQGYRFTIFKCLDRFGHDCSSSTQSENVTV